MSILIAPDTGQSARTFSFAMNRTFGGFLDIVSSTLFHCVGYLLIEEFRISWNLH